MAFIRSETFIAALEDAGVLTETGGVIRVVIDAKCGDIPKVYVEMAGDEHLLRVTQTLEGIEIDRTGPDGQ